MINKNRNKNAWAEFDHEACELVIVLRNEEPKRVEDSFQIGHKAQRDWLRYDNVCLSLGPPWIFASFETDKPRQTVQLQSGAVSKVNWGPQIQTNLKRS